MNHRAEDDTLPRANAPATIDSPLTQFIDFCEAQEHKIARTDDLVEILNAMLDGRATGDISAKFGVHSATARYRVKWIGAALDKIGVNANDPMERSTLREVIRAQTVDR